jgi:hypothetical protein
MVSGDRSDRNDWIAFTGFTQIMAVASDDRRGGASIALGDARMGTWARLIWKIVTAALVLAAAGTANAQSVAGGLSGTFSGLVYNRASGTFNSVLTLTNNGPATLYSPISVGIATGTPAVTVAGSSDGSTYIANIPGGSILTGHSAQVVVAFLDPSHVTFTPTLKYSAAGAPSAVIDAAAAVTAYSTVLLDGSSSVDPTASIQSYAWTQTAGPTVSVTGANAARASFVAPQVTSQTPLSFSLAITDTTGARSIASVTVTVSPATAAQLAVSLVSARLLAAAPPNPHTDFVPADGPPLAGATMGIQVTLTGALSTPLFTLEDANGNVLSTPSLHISGALSLQPLTFTGPITVPTVPFKVAASGTTADGQTFTISSVLFTPANMSLSFVSPILFLAAGSSGNSQLTIYNGGPTATFNVNYNDPAGLLASNQPTSIAIAGSSSATVPVTVTYPPSPGIIGPSLTATASVAGDTSRTGTATLTVWRNGAP